MAKMSGRHLTPKQARYLAGLLEGCTKEEAARRAGVASSTARRWHHDPHFQRALSQAVDSLIASTLLQLAALLGSSVEALKEGLEDAPPPQKAALALRILETLLKLRTDFDLTRRVQALENQMEGEDEARF